MKLIIKLCLVVIWCFCLVMGWRTATVPSALAASCRFRVIGSEQTTATSPKGSYQLRVDLYGSYDQEGTFCGQMSAQAALSTPPHGASGFVEGDLTNCRDNDLASLHTPVPPGGLYEHKTSVQTVSFPLGCGYASASFIGASSDPMTLFVHSDPINACGCSQWEQWRSVDPQTN